MVLDLLIKGSVFFYTIPRYDLRSLTMGKNLFR